MLKKFSRGILAFILKLGLFTFAIVTAFVLVMGTSAQLKLALKKSGVYDNFIDNVLASAHAENDQGESLDLNRPEIKSAVKAAFSPELVQASTENIVDGTYHWLNGRVPSPDFRVDLSGTKQNLANSLGDLVVNRAKTLPRCTLLQARQLQATGIDAFTVPCVPFGFDINSLRGQVANSVNSNEGFLSKPVVTADTLFKNDQGQNPFQQSQAPLIFHWLKWAPYIVGFLTVASGIGLVMLYDSRRRGLRNVSIILVGTGIVLLASIWLLNYLFSQIRRPGSSLAKTAGNDLQKSLINVIQLLNKAINHKILVFSASYIVIGAGTLIVLHYTKPKVSKPAAKAK